MKIATLAAATLIVGGVALSAPAHASNWICDALSESPTVYTVEGIAVNILTEGYSPQAGGQYLAAAVMSGCPQHIPVVLQFAEKWQAVPTV